MSLNFNFNVFGTQFPKKGLLSLDIGSSNIKTVYSTKIPGNKLRVMNYAIGETPANCIKDGIVYDIGGLGDKIEQLLAEHMIYEKNAKIVISSGSNIVSKSFRIEMTGDKTLETCIREEIKGRTDMDIKSYRLFYRVTEKTEKKGSNSYRIFTTIVPNELMKKYIKLIQYLNLSPVSIEIPYSGTARFFSSGLKIADSDRLSGGAYADCTPGITAVVDFGSENTNLCILKNGGLEFNSVILSGGRRLDERIAAGLGVKNEVARRYKNMHGMAAVFHEGDEIEKIVDECSRNYIKELLVKIKGSMEFYINRCGGGIPDRMCWIGGGSALKGLMEYAEGITGIPSYNTGMMDFNSVEFEQNLDRGNLRFLVNAVAAAL